MKTISVSELKNNVFSGEDSFGRKYELAIDGDSFYVRNYEFNGYGMAWGKWQLLNEFSGEFYIEPATDYYPAKERLHWGFGFDATGYKTRVILPKAA